MYVPLIPLSFLIFYWFYFIVLLFYYFYSSSTFLSSPPSSPNLYFLPSAFSPRSPPPLLPSSPPPLLPSSPPPLLPSSPPPSSEQQVGQLYHARNSFNREEPRPVMIVRPCTSPLVSRQSWQYVISQDHQMQRKMTSDMAQKGSHETLFSWFSGDVHTLYYHLYQYYLFTLSYLSF